MRRAAVSGSHKTPRLTHSVAHRAPTSLAGRNLSLFWPDPPYDRWWNAVVEKFDRRTGATSLPSLRPSFTPPAASGSGWGK